MNDEEKTSNLLSPKEQPSQQIETLSSHAHSEDGEGQDLTSFENLGEERTQEEKKEDKGLPAEEKEKAVYSEEIKQEGATVESSPQETPEEHTSSQAPTPEMKEEEKETPSEEQPEVPYSEEAREVASEEASPQETIEVSLFSQVPTPETKEESDRPSQSDEAILSPSREETPSAAETKEEVAPKEPEETPEETHIDFNFLETESRWLLKVIGGPNTGAEFALHGGTAYVIGSDPKQCDIIFHDMSISRKHAKISVDLKENAVIEDSESRNGTFIEGQKITSYPIKGNVMVSLGTTTFVLIDRTQEQKTIFAPKAIPSQPAVGEAVVSPKIPKEPPPQEAKPIPMEEMREATIPTIQAEVEKIKEKSQEDKQARLSKAMSSLSVLSIITVLLLVLGIGTALLFRTEAIKAPTVINPDELITKTLEPFPAVRFSYNPSNRHLLLVGHVLTEEERSRMLDSIQQLPFLKDLSYNNVVIDEFVWREINQLIAKNKEWKGITVTSPKAGQFVLSGFLKKREAAESLLEYLNQNFAYMNLLEQNIVVEEDLLSTVERDLAQAGCQGIKASFSNGELILTGAIPYDKKENFQRVLEKFRAIAGIRGVQSQVVEAGKEQAFIDLTGRYRITGFSRQGDNVSVVINGRILSRGDTLDGMVIIDITPSTIFLERDNVTYKIDYFK